MTTEIAAIQGDERPSEATASQLFEAAYLEHRAAVVRFLFALGKPEDEALDLAATTFERALREFRAGRQPGLGWLLRTARNAAVDAQRRARVAQFFLSHAATTEFAEGSVEETAIRSDTAARVRLALLELPSVQREAIALRFTSELTVREIAEIVGKGESATEKLISRGLNRLKENLDGRI